MSAHRDALFRTCGGQWLVITSDNSASIGQARQDLLAADPYLVGRLTARVAVMEAVALGASPLAVSSTLSFDFSTGQGLEVTRGILDSLAETNLARRDLTGSCESNFPAASTCLGVTVVALAEHEQLLLGQVQAGDSCYLLGLPLVGQSVLAVWPTLLSSTQIQQLTRLSQVHEILPIGSHGIKKELTGLAAAYQLRFHPRQLPGFGWDRSAGPATCVLVVGEPGLERQLQAFGQVVTLLGHWQRDAD